MALFGDVYMNVESSPWDGALNWILVIKLSLVRGRLGNGSWR